MLIRPKLAFRHAGYLSPTALDPEKTYEATPATNQPECEGKVFVQCPNGAPELLLERDDYDIVGE